MRNAFADEITRIGVEDPDVVLLSGDIGNRLFDDFKDRCPGRVINCGVAEANMMGMAAGMALNGLKPVVYTITPFTTTRCFEQIRVDVCYHEVAVSGTASMFLAPVLIVGTGAGLSYAQLGPTHHSVEDIAILRTLPGMSVLCPCDPLEVRAALRAAVKHSGPVYMRIGKKGEPAMHAQVPEFEIGRSMTMRAGTDVCLISTGNILPVVKECAGLLEQRGISARIQSFPTVKPLDSPALEQLFESYPVVAVVEEHGRIGGLGSSIAEWLVERGRSTAKLLSFGTGDEFMHVVGTQDYARGYFGLTAARIAADVASALQKH